MTATTKPLLMFRVGYMEQYDGVGEIKGGGAHVEKNGEGGEMWNFRAESGTCYGYVMTKNFSGIDLSRLDASKAWRENEELVGVDIVFFAKKPRGGQVVVGWYKNATLFHRKYRKRRGVKKYGDWDMLDYLCEVDMENAVLLKKSERVFEVPYAPVHGKGYPGHSNVWYGGAEGPNSRRYLNNLRNYLDDYAAGALERLRKGKPGRKSRRPDKDLISNIEKAAIRTTWEYFENLGYKLASVEKDNRGWDLEAIKGEELLHLEVKGHLGNVVQFELTPNEYFQMQFNCATYRVCMVRTCLSTPELTILTPTKRKNYWVLENSGSEIRVQLTEKVAAKASEIL